MYESLFDLTGRTALVTGGSKGIGKAVARGYAEAGADVMICSRHEDELQAAVAEICRPAVRARRVPGGRHDRSRPGRQLGPGNDPTGWARWTSCSTTPAATNRRHWSDTTDDVWERILELNFTSCMLLARALVPGMIQRQWGRIIHTSSVMAFASNPGRGLYSATKAALIAMARAHALELGPYGITVNCLAPGPVMTDLPMSLLNDEQKRAVRRTHGRQTVGTGGRHGRPHPAPLQRRRSVHQRHRHPGRRRYALPHLRLMTPRRKTQGPKDPNTQIPKDPNTQGPKDPRTQIGCCLAVCSNLWEIPPACPADR